MAKKYEPILDSSRKVFARLSQQDAVSDETVRLFKTEEGFRRDMQRSYEKLMGSESRTVSSPSVNLKDTWGNWNLGSNTSKAWIPSGHTSLAEMTGGSDREVPLPKNTVS